MEQPVLFRFGRVVVTTKDVTSTNCISPIEYYRQLALIEGPTMDNTFDPRYIISKIEEQHRCMYASLTKTMNILRGKMISPGAEKEGEEGEDEGCEHEWEILVRFEALKYHIKEMRDILSHHSAGPPSNILDTLTSYVAERDDMIRRYHIVTF